MDISFIRISYVILITILPANVRIVLYQHRLQIFIINKNKNVNIYNIRIRITLLCCLLWNNTSLLLSYNVKYYDFRFTTQLIQ